MSYVIVKGKKKLHAFHSNGGPIGYKRVYYTDEITGRKEFHYKKVFSTREMFAYYKDSYTRFRTLEEAESYLSMIKREILKNEKRYEEFLEGSTEELLKYASTLKIVEDDKNFND